MVSPSRYSDINVTFVLRGLRKQKDLGVEAENERIVIQRDGKTGIIDIEQEMCSGASIEHACFRVGLDVIDLYNDIIRAEEKEEQRR